MNTNSFYDALLNEGITMFTGVPDSLLKEFCACVTERTDSLHNIIAANEGNALAIATGHYLSVGKPALVYLQNSGEGNLVNPLLSLVDEDVYKIPVLLVIGWRGEPGVHDEPQHVKQGKLTLELLKTMGIEYAILEDLSQIETACQYMQKTQKPFALIVRKGTFEKFERKSAVKQQNTLVREDAIKTVVSLLNDRDIVVSTTGMISRGLYENRATHQKDFLTVGSMGHASSIAFGIAINKPKRNVFIFDGDGAFLMHMGAAGVIASRNLPNLKHIIFNNEAHDSVGGQPTCANSLNLLKITEGCGYKTRYSVSSIDEIKSVWHDFYSSSQSAFLEIKVKKGARADLGRPKEKPVDNKLAFMKFISE